MAMIKTKDEYDVFKPTIDGKMIIYLDNGKVISSSTPNYKDYVDYFCISIYPLTKSDIDDIINSNINSIRYAIVDKYEKITNRVASNKANSPINKSLKEFIKLE